MDRRGFVWAASALWAGLFSSRGAEASVARALRIDELDARSRHVVLGESLDAYCTWERIGNRRHIVTYTRVNVRDSFGPTDPSDSEILVRTLGGRVGDLGEVVPGEAVLGRDNRSVIFVRGTDVLGVTAMAQGHYPLKLVSAGRELLERSPDLGELMQPKDSAVERLAGRSVLEVRELLRTVRR